MDTINKPTNSRKISEPVRASAQSQQSHQATTQTKYKTSKTIKSKLLMIVMVFVIIAGVACGVYCFTNRHKLAGVDPNKYQAVFLTNGQVYFGRVSRASRDTVRITDIYYLQVQQSVQGQDSKDAGNKPKADTSLIKLGSELHGPDDAMYVPKSQILFWENLKGDGKVVDAIKNYQKK